MVSSLSQKNGSQVLDGIVLVPQHTGGGGSGGMQGSPLTVECVCVSVCPHVCLPLRISHCGGEEGGVEAR